MAFVHGKDSRLLLGKFSFSGYISSWEHTTERELADVTVGGGGGHKFILGLDKGALSTSGFVDNSAATGGQDETLNTALGATATSIITAAPEGLAVGKRVINIESRESTYNVSAPVADAVSYSADWMSEGQIDVGVSLHDLTAETATGNGTSVDNTASSSGGGVGALHVTAYSTFTNVVFKIQHSTDNSVWVDLITHTTVTSTTSERTTVSGTVNRYVRAIWTATGTGSVTFAAAFSRR